LASAIRTQVERIAVGPTLVPTMPEAKSAEIRDSAVSRNGKPLALVQAEVSPMNIPSSLRIATLGLAFSSVAFAQRPPSAPPSSPADGPPTVPAAPAASLHPVVTQYSRVRAFNAGPSGEVRSLYLQNGSVVDVTPALGGQLGPTVRKGEKIAVTGTKSEVNGQSLLEAASINLNGQPFSAGPPSSLPPRPDVIAQAAVPPPPGTPQAPPPPRRKKTPAPCSVSADAPPPPPGGMVPPPPPPPPQE
jgi:hypothetical protein